MCTLSAPGDGLAFQRGEIDVGVAGGAEAFGEGFDEVRHPPAAHSVLAGGEDELAGEQRLCACGCRDGEAEAAAGKGRDAGQRSVVAHRQIEHAAIPGEIGVPVLLRDAPEGGPGLRTVRRLVPRLIGEARQSQIRAGEFLRRAQRGHARVLHPDAFAAGWCLVDDDDVGDLLATQRVCDGKAALTGADDDDVVDVTAVRARSGGHPGTGGVGDAREVVTNTGLEGENSGGRRPFDHPSSMADGSVVSKLTEQRCPTAPLNPPSRRSDRCSRCQGVRCRR